MDYLTHKRAGRESETGKRKWQRRKANENGKCEVGERKTRGNWQKKVNARDEFVRPTWIDLSFPGNGARNTSATATKDLPTVPETRAHGRLFLS